MQKIVWLMAAATLAACGGDKDLDTDTDADAGCQTTVDGYTPTDGAVDAYYRANVEFELSEPDDSAFVTLTDSSGADVSGENSFSEDGETAYFIPDASLSPSSTYTATISFCDGEQTPSISFTTSPLGTALDCDPTDETYNVNLGDARFVEPEGVGELLLGSLESDILMGVLGATDSDLDFMGAISEEGGSAQDFCTPTIDFPTADFSEAPFFTVGPQDTQLSIAGVSAEISNLMISGDFASDCSFFGGGVLSGELDARVLAPVLIDLVGTDDPDDVCSMVATFNVACEPCSSDGAEYCIMLLADQITADAQEGALECVYADSCHEACAESVHNEECDVENYPVCE